LWFSALSSVWTTSFSVVRLVAKTRSLPALPAFIVAKLGEVSTVSSRPTMPPNRSVSSPTAVSSWVRQESIFAAQTGGTNWPNSSIRPT